MNVQGHSSRSRAPLWKGFVPNRTPPLSPTERAAFAGKRILITGAGGFLGSALTRHLASIGTAHLTLLDNAEYGLYRLDQHLRSRPMIPSHELIVGSINDAALLGELFTRNPPDLVFHAAARKHVPLMEENLLAAAETNILGTLALIRAAQHAPTPTFVHLSTDKAVEPISIMGATKQIAEQILLAARATQPSGTNLQAVRLCNVLGSTGSVAPLFARQIAAGAPVTVTHPDATRFFLSTSDAVRHLLRAAITPTQTGLLIPAVDQPHRVQDLARYMLGRAPGGLASAGIAFTGLRAADKLHEHLLAPGERVTSSPNALLQQVSSPVDLTVLPTVLTKIEAAVSTRDRSQLLQAIERLVPGFHPHTALAEVPA